MPASDSNLASSQVQKRVGGKPTKPDSPGQTRFSKPEIVGFRHQAGEPYCFKSNPAWESLVPVYSQFLVTPGKAYIFQIVNSGSLTYMTMCFENQDVSYAHQRFQVGGLST